MQVVMSLIRLLLKKGYCLTTDNYYTSPQLADILLTFQTNTYGTAKQNRKEIPPQLKKNKLGKGETIAFCRGKVLVRKWKDKKDVTMLSTVHTNNMVDVTYRDKVVKKPKVVTDYNQTMGGDQYLCDYSIARKRGKKYYKKIFFLIIYI